MQATHMTAAAERISRRFAEDELRANGHRGLVAVPPRPRGAFAQHMDAARAERTVEADVPAIEEAPNRPMPAGRPVAWSPVAAPNHGAAVEQYRRLAAALIRAQAEHGAKVFMVTSSVAGEGKSLTASNLAVTLSRSYLRRTLVIDADQRDPSQHQIFRVDNRVGLTDYLRSPGDDPAGTVELFQGLTLLPAGRPTHDPMGGLTSRRMKQLIADAAAAFDFVIVDTPPATLIPDASLLAPLVDAVVLVIAAGVTQFEAIDQAIATVGRNRILGTVLNKASDPLFGRAGYGYGDGYGYGPTGR
jgi:capsular exopolysaccharide synthesis family protein